MVHDFDALGRYTHAHERMERAFTERHNLATRLATLADNVTRGVNESRGVVTAFAVREAQEILSKMSKLEKEIASAITEMNINAPNCGKQVTRFSDQ